MVIALLIFGLLYIAGIIVVIAGFWKTFQKAGKPGWACLIPIYNYYTLTKIGGVKNWGFMFIPIYNLYYLFVVMIAVAKSFGKDTGFGVGLVLLGIIFFPILGFGKATYIGPNGINALKDDIDSIGNN